MPTALEVLKIRRQSRHVAFFFSVTINLNLNVIAKFTNAEFNQEFTLRIVPN